MTAALTLGARPAAHALQPTYLMVALIATAALWLQLPAFPNHDVAWVLWGTRRMIEGATWGRDIIEPNPPLAWYLSMPSTWLATKLGLPIAATFQTTVAAAALASILAFDKLLRDGANSAGYPSRLPTLIAAVTLLILPYRDFGQREHLTLIATLPYLALVTRRCRGGTVPPAAALAIGLVAGLGLALKPYFLAVPALVEASAMLLTRRWLFPLRAETLAIGGVILAYAAFLLQVERSYVDTVVPLAQGIYWSFNVPWPNVVLPILPPLLATAAMVAAARGGTAPLPAIIAAAVVGFAVACLAQQKGYSYHQFPVWAGAALVAAATASATEGVRRAIAHALLAILLLVGALHTASWWRENRADGSRAAETRRIVEAIDLHAAGGRFLAVAVHPYPAFPAALYVDAGWSSRTNSQWFLPAVAQLRDGGGDPAALAFAERHARAFILHDLSQDPDLVVIDTNAARHTRSPRDFDILGFYLEDPRFAARWSAYREARPVGAYRLFVRGARP